MQTQSPICGLYELDSFSLWISQNLGGEQPYKGVMQFSIRVITDEIA